jgi:chemotaxis signal transduction protein
MSATAEGDLSDRQDVVAFRLGQQAYALPIEPMVQIVEMVTITSIPQLSAVVEGVINVHGEAVAVVKLRRHLGLPDAPLQLNTPLLLVRIDGRTVGLIVDEVIDVFSLAAEQIARFADILPEELESAPILRGLTYVAGDAVLVLDPDNLFRPDQLNALAQAADLLQEAIAKKESEEPPVEPKPIRKRKAAPRKRASEKPPAETQPKTAHRRRANKPARKTSRSNKAAREGKA